ncbi:hypothetical protein ONV78_26050 [Hahella sp. CR1]|uniref:hypothetical protein n=1 Tax=Hahella sp. CR1 TaxID=2992807 RepID=UPI002441ABF7|nr:hypothetical protein [Hahella sp. CR1]MDG9671224.1 hypothetical protein [Hahella sp. CR1]
MKEKMPNLLIFSLLLSTSFIASAKVNDFDVVCTSFKELIVREGIDTLAYEEKVKFVTQYVRNNLRPDAPALDAWLAVAAAEEGLRYELFQEAAASMGYKDYRCDEMQRLIE